ncbi:MAG: FG-GAP-like repeat-containing protein [Endozoicomonas sp.]
MELEALSDQELEQRLKFRVGQLGMTGQPAADEKVPDIRISALAQLGRELFFSKNLSGDRDIACASCHHPLLGGADALSLPVGVDAREDDLVGPGRLHDGDRLKDPEADGGPNVERNSPTTFNSIFYRQGLFFDGRVEFFQDREVIRHKSERPISTPDSLFRMPDPEAGSSLLQAQARLPLVALNEMRGFSREFFAANHQVRQRLVQRFREDVQSQTNSRWRDLFRKAFSAKEPASDSPKTLDVLITMDRITLALAEYQKSQVFINSPWRDWINNKEELSRQAKLGALLFYTPRETGGVGCFQCHSGDFFTDERFAILAVPQFGRGKSVHNRDLGRYGVTRHGRDLFGFRTPSLLNVTETAPYGHTGAFLDLEGIVRHHLDPRRSIEQFDFSLQQLPQFKGLGVDYPEARNNTQSILKILELDKNSPAYKARSSSDQSVELQRVQTKYVVSFLKTLTDPCVTEPACLTPWLPTEPVMDAFTLQARIPRQFDNSISRIWNEPELSQESVQPAVLPELHDEGLYNPRCSASGRRPQLKRAVGFSKLWGEGFLSSQEGTYRRQYLRSDQTSMKRNIYLTRFMSSGGVASGDLDGDCLTDLVVSMGSDAAPAVFLNRGEVGFQRVAGSWGLEQASGMAGAMLADLNGDGWLDLVAGSIADRGEVYVYLHNRRDSFVPVAKPGIQAHTPIGAGLGDIDGDGDLDLFLAEWSHMVGAEQEHLWLNNGKGLFRPGGREYGLTGHIGEQDYTLTPNFADLDGDGWADLLLTSDYFMTQFFMNDNGRALQNHTDKDIINDENGMGAAIADFDNDGDLDWFLTSIFQTVGDHSNITRKIGSTGNRLYRNEGRQNSRQVFRDVTDSAGVRDGGWGWGACAKDFNNDGWLDIFHVNSFFMHPSDMSRYSKMFDLRRKEYEQLAKFSDSEAFAAEVNRLTGRRVSEFLTGEGLGEFHNEVLNDREFMKIFEPFSGQPSRLFINNRDGTFTEQAADLGIADTGEGRGIACFDQDRDGDIDVLIVNNTGEPAFYRNDLSGPDTHYLTVKLLGKTPNVHAIGARLYLETPDTVQMREVRVENNYISQNPIESHFGLGAHTQASRLTVVWPDGTEQSFSDLAGNRMLVLRQP